MYAGVPFVQLMANFVVRPLVSIPPLPVRFLDDRDAYLIFIIVVRGHRHIVQLVNRSDRSLDFSSTVVPF